MSTLTLTFAAERARYGHRAAATPSRFLFEAQGEALPEGWVGIEAELEDEDDEEPAAPSAQKRAGKKAGRGRAPARRARRGASRA
jgi:hypothetical protein